MNHEEQFMQELKVFIEMDAQHRSIEQLTIRQRELGPDECQRLIDLYQFYKRNISLELMLAADQYSRDEITSAQFRAIMQFVQHPMYEPFIFDQVEELEWRYQCVKERAIPMRH